MPFPSPTPSSSTPSAATPIVRSTTADAGASPSASDSSDAAAPTISGRAAALMHPVRLRILTALEGRSLTPRQLGVLLPDVPQASLYRHVKRLADHDLLRVVGERQVHGTVEREYAAVPADAILSPDDVAQITPQIASTYFRSFLTLLLSAFDRYAAQDAPLKLHDDGVVFYSVAATLADNEFVQLKTKLRVLLDEAHAQPAGPERRRRVLAIVSVPEPADAASLALAPDEPMTQETP